MTSPLLCESRKQAQEIARKMPGNWRVSHWDSRFEFRFASIPGKRFVTIKYRSTKPIGWVCFETVEDERRPVGSRQSWAKRKKILAESFETPIAAAAALILAELVEVDRAYVRGAR